MKVLFCFLALSVALACGTVVQVIDCGGKSIILYIYLYIYIYIFFFKVVNSQHGHPF